MIGLHIAHLSYALCHTVGSLGLRSFDTHTKGRSTKLLPPDKAPLRAADRFRLHPQARQCSTCGMRVEFMDHPMLEGTDGSRHRDLQSRNCQPVSPVNRATSRRFGIHHRQSKVQLNGSTEHIVWLATSLHTRWSFGTKGRKEGSGRWAWSHLRRRHANSIQADAGQLNPSEIHHDVQERSSLRNRS